MEEDQTQSVQNIQIIFLGTVALLRKRFLRDGDELGAARTEEFQKRALKLRNRPRLRALGGSCGLDNTKPAVANYSW